MATFSITPIQCSYRLSSGGGGSDSEDELYDKREADIFRRVTAGTHPAPPPSLATPTADTGSVSSGDTLPLPEEEEEEEKEDKKDHDPYGGSTDEDTPGPSQCTCVHLHVLYYFVCAADLKQNLFISAGQRKPANIVHHLFMEHYIPV